MTRLLLTLVLILLIPPAYARAISVSVGGVEIRIPPPVGYVMVTPEMKSLYVFFQHRVGPNSQQLAAFVPSGAASVALRGGLPASPRRFGVDVLKGLAKKTTSRSAFLKMRELVKSNNNRIFASLQDEFPQIVRRLNADLAARRNPGDLALPSSITALPMHYEAPDAFAYSTYIKFQNTDLNGDPIAGVAATTSAVVLVHGKVVQLLCSDDDGDLAWTREACAQWSRAAIAANL